MNITFKEEAKDMWKAIKHHGHRLLVGCGAVTLAVNAFMNSPILDWVVVLAVSYFVGLVFTWKKSNAANLP